MKINIDKFPKKARKNLQFINSIIENAEDKLFSPIQIDYNTGSIRFESLLTDHVYITIYSTTLTVLVENLSNGRREYFYNKNAKQVNKVINNNQKG